LIAYVDYTVVLVGILVGCGLAAAIMFGIRSKLKSVRSQRTACNYVRGGSFKVTGRQDVFLFHNVTRIPIQTQGSPSPGGRRRR